MQNLKKYALGLLAMTLFPLSVLNSQEEFCPRGFSLQSLLEEEEHHVRTFINYDAIINLGGNCQVAYQLKINGLRNYSLPFDYWNTPFNSLYLLLERRFTHFFDKNQFMLVTTEHETYILQKEYGVIMRHDFQLNQHFLDDYDIFKEKFERRIERFFKEIETHNKILFIRNRITKQQAQQLDVLLDLF